MRRIARPIMGKGKRVRAERRAQPSRVEENDDAFLSEVVLGIGLALDWGIIPLGEDQRLRYINWRFEDNQITGQPGLVVIEDNSIGFELAQCTFLRCDSKTAVHLLAKL